MWSILASSGILSVTRGVFKSLLHGWLWYDQLLLFGGAFLSLLGILAFVISMQEANKSAKVAANGKQLISNDARYFLDYYEQQKTNWKYYVHLELVGVSLVKSESPVINFTFELQNFLPIELRLLRVLHSSGTVSAGALGSCDLPALPEGIEQRVDRGTKIRFTMKSGTCTPSVLEFLERVSTKGQLLQWFLKGEWHVEVYGKTEVWAYTGHDIQYDQVVK